MARFASCWTCRLRRKKCDRGQPACQACSALNIRCHYSADRPNWMDGGEKQDEMARCFKAQVKQGKEKQREQGYIQVLNIGGPLPDAAPSAPEGSTASSSHSGSPVWTFDGIPAVNAFKELDVDFTMLYMDQVFPFLFPFYAPPMIQGGRAWVLDVLRHNETVFHAVMSLSTYFFSLVLSSEGVSGLEVCRQNIWTQLEGYANSAIRSLQSEVLAMNQQGSTTLLQKTHAMESITQLMVLEMAVENTNDSGMHLAAATSLFEEIIEGSRTDGRTDIRLVMAELERPSWAPLITQRPIWNTEQAAIRFFFAILLWADIVSATSLQTVPRLVKYYPDLISHAYGGDTTEPLLRMEEYVGCEGWVLIAIAKTAELDVWKQQELRNGASDSEELARQAGRIYGALQHGLEGLEQRCTAREKEPRRILRGFYKSRDANQATKQDAATRIWAHAARIYLTVVTRGWRPQDLSICESVGGVLRLLQEQGDPAILRSSVWPFCVAGCVADASQEDGFRDLVAASGSLQSFGRVGESLRIMERVWSRRGDLSVEWDFKTCFSILGAPVMLL